MPFAPSSAIERCASATAASMSDRDTVATNAGKRSGCRAHSSANPSLARRARRPASAGVATPSSAGCGREDDLTIIAVAIHFAETLVEIDDRLNRLHPIGETAQTFRMPGQFVKELLWENMGIEIDQHFGLQSDESAFEPFLAASPRL